MAILPIPCSQVNTGRERINTRTFLPVAHIRGGGYNRFRSCTGDTVFSPDPVGDLAVDERREERAERDHGYSGGLPFGGLRPEAPLFGDEQALREGQDE
jgi:hypothetical protein